MGQITVAGKPVEIEGELPLVGSQAPEFLLVDSKLNDIGLSKFKQKRKLLSINPSLDTEVCLKTIVHFDKLCGAKKDVVVLNISSDLPFAQQRICREHQLRNIINLSVMRSSSFGTDYGVLMKDGKLKGLLARAVLILDENNKVVYRELVNELTEEPDYKASMEVLC